MLSYCIYALNILGIAHNIIVIIYIVAAAAEQAWVSACRHPDDAI